MSVRAAQSNGGAKPRVLLVDDHRHIIDAVGASLAEDFDVAGVATDGMQAVETAFRVNPDVIVLDVSMPGIDGFQTFRALENAGSRTPVVFLSMYDADVYVSEAFRCGGRGFVLKSNIQRDLSSALDQALLGRLFVPSLTSLYRLAEGGRHAMQVHDDDESFLDGLATLFDLALRLGDATCVIGPEQIRQSLGDRLRARGWNVGGSFGHNRYLAVDASDALNRFMRNGLPDETRLAKIAAEMDEYRRSVAERETSRLTIFGNMSMLLTGGQRSGGNRARELLGQADPQSSVPYHLRLFDVVLPWRAKPGLAHTDRALGTEPRLASGKCKVKSFLSLYFALERTNNMKRLLYGALILGWIPTLGILTGAKWMTGDVVDAQSRTPVKVTRIYTGADGKTKLEEFELPLKPRDKGSEVAASVALTTLQVRRTTPEY